MAFESCRALPLAREILASSRGRSVERERCNAAFATKSGTWERTSIFSEESIVIRFDNAAVNVVTEFNADAMQAFGEKNPEVLDFKTRDDIVLEILKNFRGARRSTP